MDEDEVELETTKPNPLNLKAEHNQFTFHHHPIAQSAEMPQSKNLKTGKGFQGRFVAQAVSNPKLSETW